MAKGNRTELPGYELLGILAEGGGVRVYDAACPGERYTVNRVELCPDTEPLLRKSLECRRAGHCRSLAEVRADHGHFFLVLRAPQAPALSPSPCAALPLSRRFTLLRAFLLELYEARELPFPLVLSAAAPGNIRVGKGGSPRLRFALEEAALHVAPEDEARALYRAVAVVVRLLFRRELENEANSALRILVGKCEGGLYPSIPALVSELVRQEEDCAAPDWERWATKMWNRCAPRVVRAGKRFLPVAAVAALCAALLLFPRTGGGVVESASFTIGNIVYAPDPLSASRAELTQAAPEEPDAETAPPAIVLCSEADRFSDHVVRSGETLAAICAGYYGDAALAPAVAAYNGLEITSPLEAGTILKLPEPMREVGEAAPGGQEGLG